MGFVAQYRNRSAQQQTAAQGEIELPEFATGVVHHDAVAPDGSVVHHHQRFEAGRLVEWERDDAPGPWALVRPGDPLEPCPTDVATPEQVAAAGVRLGDELLPLPLLDDLPSPAFDSLPHVPDATARLRFEVTGTPVGTQRSEVRYVDGSRTAWLVADWEDPEPGSPAADAPDMGISLTFRNYLFLRSGRATALEAIADGGLVDARWTMLLLLHGLVQQPEYVAANRSLPRLPDELGWWGLVAPFVGLTGPLDTGADGVDDRSPDDRAADEGPA